MARRALLPLGLLLTLATCRDGIGPRLYSARVAVAPIFPSDARLAAFGLSIDRVQFVVVRRVAPDTLADTTVGLPPDARTLDLRLRVRIVSSPETLLVSIVALAGAVPLFQGSAPVEVASGVVSQPTDVPVTTYVGPGAGVDSIAILPRIPFIFFGDSLRFQVLAFQARAPVPQFYVSWKTSDTTLAHINGIGSLRAPLSRSNVWVIARTPGAIADSVKATFQPIPTQLVMVGGTGQSGTVGLPLLLPLEVEVRAADNLPVGGVAVRFRPLSATGSVTDTVSVTDATGRARTTATLGSLIGLQSFEARVNGLTGSPATFSVTALAGAAAQLLVAAGDGLLASVNTLLPTAPAVGLRDAFGNPVAGVSVAFLPTGGGGSVTGGNQVTDATGLATVGSWTLGTIAGANTLTASGAGLTHVFNANGVAGPATALLATAGDLQSAVVGAMVGTAPALRAQDQFGNPVPGAAITFAVSRGGGRVSGPTQLTNAAGIATVGAWTLGTATGANALTATLAGLTPVTFTATGLAGAATQILQLAGGGQSAIVNTILPTAAAVIVRDQFNNPVPGVAVVFAPASGGGSVTSGSAVTDTGGVARVGSWRLGTLVGQNTLTATAGGLTGSPVLFSASGLRDVAAQLLRVSIDTQTAIAGQAVSTPPVVRVADQYGNAVPGASVTFTLTGALVGSLAPSVATTDALGVARVTSWTLAAVAGVNTLDATVPGLAGSPMTFSANGIVTTATNIIMTAGSGQSGVVGSVLPTAYSVAVKNAALAPVQGVPVHWAAGPAGGSMNLATSVTDVNGIASSTRTLGPGAGTQTATASVSGLAGSPVTFAANALAGAATQLVKQSADPQTGTVATAVVAPVVKVADQFGNAVSGVIVDFVAGSGGALGATKSTSDTAGLATAGSWTLDSLVGTNTVTVTAGVLAAKTFTATSVAGPPARLAFLTGPTRGLAGNTMAPVQVEIRDRFGNRVLPAKDSVTLGLGPGSNAAARLHGTVVMAAVNGVATLANFVIDSAGVGDTLIAKAVGLADARSNTFDVGGVIKAIPVTRLGPVAAALNTSTKRIYVPGASLVSVLLDDKELLPQIPGFDAPFAVAANAASNKIYVSTPSSLVAINGATLDVVLGPIAVGTGAKGIAVDEKANLIYVAVGKDPLQRGPALVPVDGSKDAVVLSDVVALPDSGMGVAFNPNNGFVYVVIPRRQSLVVIDPKPGSARVVDEIFGLGKGANAVAIDVLTNVAYVTNRDESSLSVVDLVKRSEQRRLVGNGPAGLGIDSNRRVVYVANSLSGSLSLIDTNKLNVFATLVVGQTPKAAVVDPSTGRVYVPSQLDDVVRVIQP